MRGVGGREGAWCAVWELSEWELKESRKRMQELNLMAVREVFTCQINEKTLERRQRKRTGVKLFRVFRLEADI